MANDLTIQGEVVVSSEKAEAAFDKIGKKADQMASGVSSSSDKAGKSMDDFGAGAEKGSERFSRAEARIRDQAKKLTSNLETLGKTASEKLQFKIAEQGLDASKLEPFIAKLRAAEQGMADTGMSAKAMNAAMRGVPAQISDIVVSLQGGQKPMTVFLQQGLQLRDMFGGFGEAGKALGSTLLGVVNPLTVAGAAAVALGAAYYQGSKEVDALRLALVTTGNASGVSVTQLQQMAAQMGAISGAESVASAALADFVQAGVRGTDTLKEYTQAAIDWEKATGTSVDKTAKAFAKLQDEPLKAAMELQKGMNFLTVATYEEARALEEQGRKAESTALLQREYAKALNNGSKEIRDNLGTLERTWDKLGRTASTVWSLMLGAGRAATLADKMGGVRDDIAAMERQLALGAGFGNTGGGAATGRGTATLTLRDTEALRERIRLRKEELGTLEKTAQAEKSEAERKAAEQAKVEARNEWNQRGLRYLSDEKKLQKELNQERELGIKAGYSEAEINKRLAEIREDYAKKHKSSNNELKKDLADQAKVYAELAGLSSTYYQELSRGQKQLSAGKLTQEQYVKYVEDLIQKQPFAIALAKEEEKARRDLQKAIEDDIKQADRLAERRQAAIKSAEDAMRKARQEEEAHALAAAANITLAEAVERLTIARLEDQLQMARMGTESQATIDALERELRARKELLGELQQKGAREANKKAADQAAKDWEKVSQTIGRTLSDYIMSGGKDAATYLKRLFSTLVLQPVIEYGVSQLMGVDLKGSGNAAGAAGRLSGTIQGNALTDWSTWGSKGGDWLMSQSTELGLNGMQSMGDAAFALGDTIKSVDTWLKDIPGFSGGIGSAAGYLGSVLALTQGKVGTGVGSAIGTWALPGIGTMIGGALGGLIDDLFGSDSVPRFAATAEYRSGTTSRGWTPDDQWNDAIYPTVSALALGIGSALDATAKTFGKTAGYELFASFSKDAENKGVFGALNITGPDGKSLVDWSQYDTKWGGRHFSDGDAGEKEFMAAITADVKTAFQSMDIPTWSKQLINAAENIDGINAALQQIGTVKAVFDGLGKSMEMFTGISGELQTQLLSVSGGIDALASNAGAYYEGFYSEQERMEILARNLRESLGGMNLSIDPMLGDDAKEQFRATVAGAMDAGQGELAAKLLAMAGSFATAADYAQKQAEESSQAIISAAQEAAQAAQELASSLRSSLIGLEARFAEGGFSRQYQAQDAAGVLQGLFAGVGIQKDSAVLTQQILAATAPEIEAYFRSMWGMLDSDAARQQLVDVTGSLLDLAEAAKQSAEAVDNAAKQQRESLEQQYLQLIGNTAELRRRELEALDPSNRALQQLIWSIQDGQSAFADMGKAVDSAAATARQAWSNWGTANNLGLKYLSDTSGLEAQRAILQAQIGNSSDPADRLSKLQELIGIEEALGNAEMANRKAEQAAINARQAALQKELSAAQALLSAAQSLGDYAKSLQTSAASGLSDTDRLAALGSQYTMLMGKARGGDKDALSQLQGVSSDYLSLAQTLAVSGSDYSVLSGRIASELDKLATGQESTANWQISSAQSQLDQLAAQSEALNAQVEISDATKGLIAKSMIDQAEIWDRENTQYLSMISLQEQMTGKLGTLPADIYKALKPAMDSSASYIASSVGSSVSSAISALAKMLGLDGSHASGLSYVPFDGYRAELHKGERVLTAAENSRYSAPVPLPFVVQASQGNAGLVAELMTEVRALRAEVAALRAPMEQTAAATAQQAEQFDNVTAGGNAMATEVMA